MTKKDICDNNPPVGILYKVYDFEGKRLNFLVCLHKLTNTHAYITTEDKNKVYYHKLKIRVDKNGRYLRNRFGKIYLDEFTYVSDGGNRYVEN